MSIEDLRAAALALPSPERARLAHELLLSLEAPDQEEIDSAWAREISRRAKEIADGTVQPIDAEVAFERIRRRLRERREAANSSGS